MLEHMPTLHLLVTRSQSIQFFRENQIGLACERATGTLQADKSETAKAIIRNAS
jgi:hypothetical protein